MTFALYCMVGSKVQTIVGRFLKFYEEPQGPVLKYNLQISFVPRLCMCLVLNILTVLTYLLTQINNSNVG
jgi:hypothetical protein